MNFVELHKFDADQLKQLMSELVAAGQGGMLNDRSNTTAKEFIERYAYAVHEFAPEYALRNKFPRIESNLTTEERAADVRLFKNVTLRAPEHRSAAPNSNAATQRLWLAP